jgi:hypothetical protein
MDKLQSLLNKHNYKITANELISRIYKNKYDKARSTNRKLDINKIGTFITEKDFNETDSGNKYITLRNECIYSLFGKSDEENYFDDEICFYGGCVLCQACNDIININYSLFGGSRCGCGLIDLNDE